MVDKIPFPVIRHFDLHGSRKFSQWTESNNDFFRDFLLFYIYIIYFIYIFIL